MEVNKKKQGDNNCRNEAIIVNFVEETVGDAHVQNTLMSKCWFF